MYTVPYFWGGVGILYDTNVVDEDDLKQGWEILRNPKYKGNLYMYDSERDSFMIALKALGYSMNTTDEAEYEEAYQWLVEQNKTGASFAGLEVDHGKAVASAFSGMTVDEFEEYVEAFKEQSAPGYVGMKRGEGFYKPMLEVISLLIKNDFKVYVVSGTDRLIVRGICDGTLEIPKSQMIGSDETICASGQGNADGLDYVFTEDDKLILGGDFIIKNLMCLK